MKILIQDTDIEVTVDFESRQAPCPGCANFQKGEDGELSKCMAEDKTLSSELIDSCEKNGWRR